MSIAFQSAIEHAAAIRNMGCEYLDILASISHYTQRSISTEIVNGVWAILVSEGLVDSINGLHDTLSYYRAYDLTFNLLELPDHAGDQVGQIVDGKITYWAWVKDHSFNYAIRRMMTGLSTPHSVLLNKDLMEIYDPAPEYPGGKTIGIYLFQVLSHEIPTNAPH